VWADPRLVSRILHNLVGNSIKFTREGGAVRVSALSDSPSALRVAVSDDGPGIPPELRERLFQKFTTGDVKGRGTGLGLAFCRLAVEAHGGRIWVDTPPGGGTTFSFTLPLAV
jgi:signal transduction histidine kinase